MLWADVFCAAVPRVQANEEARRRAFKKVGEDREKVVVDTLAFKKRSDFKWDLAKRRKIFIGSFVCCVIGCRLCGCCCVVAGGSWTLFLPALSRPDDQAKAVILPIFGIPVPFHVSTIKNVIKNEDGNTTLLRVTFQNPGVSFANPTAKVRESREEIQSLPRCEAESHIIHR